MKKSRFSLASAPARRVVLTALAVLISCTAASAQATRTWVSGVGDDANPCSRTAPCKTFAGAIAKTAPGGEIDVLDPGGFGAVTITKSISIEANGLIAGVLVSGTNGIVVSAGPGDVVVLRGLTIEGLGTGLSGILVNSGGALYVEGCFINNFIQKGIDFNPSGNANLFVSDTIIRNNNGPSSGGIDVRGSATTLATLDHVRLESNAFGFRNQTTNGKAIIRDSVVSRSSGNGVFAIAGEINTDHVSIFANTNGVITTGGTIRLNDTTIANNTTGITGSNIFTYNNNHNGGNTTPGAPSGGVIPGVQ